MGSRDDLIVSCHTNVSNAGKPICSGTKRRERKTKTMIIASHLQMWGMRGVRSGVT